MARAMAWSISVAAAIGCAGSDHERDSAAEQPIEFAVDDEPPLSRPMTETAPQSLAVERRASLNRWGHAKIERLVAERRPARENAQGDENGGLETQSVVEETPGMNSEDGVPPEKLGGALEKELADLAEEHFQKLVEAVHESETGGFYLEDVFFEDEDVLKDHLLMRAGALIEKGLIIPSTAWPREGCSPFCLDPPNVSICWTTDSNADASARNRVATLVQNTWGRLSDTVFDFTDANGASNFCNAPGPWDIRIYHHSTLTRGCSKAGNTSQNINPLLNLNCENGPTHASASMLLPYNAAAGNTIFEDYNAVHEFGHAIGLAHEQIRLEYNWEDPDANPGPPDPAAFRNCESADINITYIPPGLFLNERRTPADIGGQTVGDFDDHSIMYYCQQEESLAGGNAFIDARASQISLGDIMSSHALYEARFNEVFVGYSSWYSAPLQVTIDLLNSSPTNFAVTGQQSSQTLDTNMSDLVGNDYTASATTTDARLRCSTALPSPQEVFQVPRIVPLVPFQTTPVRVTCYDPALVSRIATALVRL